MEMQSDLLHDLASTESRVRLGANKALRERSQRRPDLVYPFFDVVAGLLGHENNILKWNAILTLAHLAGVDTERKLDPLLDDYLAPISGPVMITAANTIKGATLIAQHRPDLAGRIVARLLGVSKARYATPECRNVAIGHTLEALLKMRNVVADKRAVQIFAKRQLANPRKATSTKAARLLASLESASKSRSRS